MIQPKGAKGGTWPTAQHSSAAMMTIITAMTSKGKECLLQLDRGALISGLG